MQAIYKNFAFCVLETKQGVTVPTRWNWLGVFFFPFFYLWVPLINAADIINFILRPHSAALGRRSVTKMKLLWHTALFEISLFFPNTALEFFIQCRFTLEFSRAAQPPANGLKIKLYPHQSILIREINITHTTPKSKPPPLQTNPTQTFQLMM